MKQNKMNIGICTSEVGFISLNISKYIYIQDPNNRCYIFCFIKNLDYYRKEKFLEINSHFNKKNKIIFLPTYFLKIFRFFS